MVKYADNAWHALKVAFGNEIGNLCKAAGVDSHEVMDIFCQDTKLNISAAYLRPGFAFGGSCLPKDVRALDLPASRDSTSTCRCSIAACRPTNGRSNAALEMIARQTGKRSIGFLGFSFKAGTDDLRESPYVDADRAADRQGLRDPRVRPERAPGARCVGANQRLHLSTRSRISPN